MFSLKKFKYNYFVNMVYTSVKDSIVMVNYQMNCINEKINV
jgi:hypothetical protein